MRVLSLGAGNMASALLGPIVSEFDSFCVYSPGKSSQIFADSFGAHHIESIEDLEDNIDILVLAFKPQMFDEACDFFLKHSSLNLENTLVVSMLAGTPQEVISKKFDTNHSVRIMPNTPALVGHGVTLFLAHPKAQKTLVSKFQEVLKKTGQVINATNEDQFDQWTATTGSGPAYVFEFARILESQLVEQGMSESSAKIAIKELFLGSSLMMSKSTDDFETLREKVTSKKGVTFEALEVFKNEGFEKIVNKALKANINRSKELKNIALDRKEK